MNESLFVEFIKSIFPKLSLYVHEKEQPKNRTYLHKSMLREVYSADQKWEGTSANTTYVAADIVEMDSPLPIKKRGSIATSNGKLPKIGMKKILFESDINTVNIMKARYQTSTNDQARNAEKTRIITKLMDDGVACSVGIDEKNEKNFLEALCNGVIAVEDADNTGKAIRYNYGYLEENSFKTETNDGVEKDDLQRVFDKADKDGNTIVKVMLSKTCFNNMRRMQWARELAADYQGKVYDSDSKLPVPSASVFADALEDEFGATFERVDRTVIVEKNKKRTSVKPWSDDRIVFLCNDEVGSLVWGTLAEATNPVEGVQYSTVDQYKLISKYSKNEPSLQEFTAGQALVLPVIEDVDQIYTLTLGEAEEVDDDAEAKDTSDIYTTYKGKKYKKADLITQLKALGANVKSNSTDETIIKAINALSDEDEATLLSNLTAVE